LEFSSRRADSQALAATTMARALMRFSVRVVYHVGNTFRFAFFVDENFAGIAAVISVSFPVSSRGKQNLAGAEV